MTSRSGPPEPPWPHGELFPRYSDAEYQLRWQRLRANMAAAEVDIAIVAGSGTGRAEIQFLTNAPVRWESLLVVPTEDDGGPHILMQLDNHALGLEPWSTVPITPVGPGVAAAAAAEVLRHAGLDARVGLLGPFSERMASALRSSLPDASFENLAPAFGRDRMIKSQEELAWMRYGAALCDHAISTFLDQARSGQREDELGSLLQGAVLDQGGQIGILFLATLSMADGGAAAPRQTWARRRTTSDDAVMFELSAGFGGATSQILRTVSLGARPSSVIRELHELADATFRRILEKIGPGRSFAELESLGAMIEEAGFGIVDDLVHGYGGGYLRPHIRTPATRREPPGDDRLAEGMTLVIQPNVVTPDRRFGVQTGELVVVTKDGAETPHLTPRGLLTISRQPA